MSEVRFYFVRLKWKLVHFFSNIDWTDCIVILNTDWNAWLNPKPCIRSPNRFYNGVNCNCNGIFRRNSLQRLRFTARV